MDSTRLEMVERPLRPLGEALWEQDFEQSPEFDEAPTAPTDNGSRRRAVATWCPRSLGLRLSSRPGGARAAVRLFASTDRWVRHRARDDARPHK